MSKLRGVVVDGATLAAAAAAVAVAVSVITDRRGPGMFEREDRVISGWESLLERGHRLGSEDPRLTIVEFGDYQCPACRSMHSVLDAFVDEHRDEVALVYRHWPLEQHADARPAARAAECAANQSRFWEYHRALYTQRWTPASFLDLAGDAGIENLDAFALCVSSNEPVAGIEADVQAALELDGLGTPTLVLNGVLLGKMPSTDDLREHLERAQRGWDRR
jgi:protein-disulfide isomerase